MIKFIYIYIIWLFTSCVGSHEVGYKRYCFKELDSNTVKSFMTLFNSKIKNTNWSCMSVDKNCPCFINYEQSILTTNANIYIKSCNNYKITLPVGLTSAKLFVITAQGVFFPIVAPYGFKEEDKYLDVLKLDSIEYGFVSWQP